MVMCGGLYLGFNGVTASAASQINTTPKTIAAPKTTDNVNILKNGTYVNDNGIKINKAQYDNLISQGFEPLDIQIMSNECFNLNKNIHASVISKTIKHIKTTEVYDKTSLSQKTQG